MSVSGYNEMLKTEPRRSLPKISCPIAMIHGTVDEHVPFELSAKYVADHKHVKLYPVP